MNLSKIWERYFFKELIKVFLLFLFAFFFLYVAIDYSSHAQDFFRDKKIQIKQLSLYYLSHFIKRLDLLFPLALLIATIKTLTSLNIHRELLALQASGVRLRTLLKPFFLLSILGFGFNLLNFAFFVPSAHNFLDEFHDSHFRHSYHGKRAEPIRSLQLKDRSKLIFQSYDAEKNAFFDVFWIRSLDDIWHMKYFSADVKEPIGQYVDHLQRNSSRILEKTESYTTARFPQLKWQQQLSQKGDIPAENYATHQLLFSLFQKKELSSYKRAEILTQTCFKILMPLLSPLVVIAVSGFCILYRRHHNYFILYALAIFSFVTFFTAIDAFVILGENEVLPSLLSLPLLFGSLFFLASRRFIKVR